jgi:hypothetical protein
MKRTPIGSDIDTAQLAESHARRILGHRTGRRPKRSANPAQPGYFLLYRKHPYQHWKAIRYSLDLEALRPAEGVLESLLRAAVREREDLYPETQIVAASALRTAVYDAFWEQMQVY